ncbi:MAG TPA: alkaline phosphatase PhoX [Patescibacteria group bacterium]|nr:alkaline phosphatase PhoX [Patescibacteria group bacterium]
MRAIPFIGNRRLLTFAAALAIALPAPVLAAAGSGGATPPGSPSYVTASPAYVASSGVIAGVEIKALVNSGETAFGTLFEGIPDGIGVVPGPGPLGYVDLYVNHEQSRVPFGGFADFNDSSVSKVRLDLASKSIIDMDVALSSDEGFIRFCSNFMAGPEQGFPVYTLLTNEESNDPLAVPAGAVYGPDPAYGGQNVRQAGYTVTLDTATGKVRVLAGAGRHNHENQVVVPGGWNGIVSLSGDDTFTFPSTPARPNLSQLYAFSSKNWKSFQKDDGTLWAFRVTGTQDGPVDPADPFNGANDYLDINVGDNFTGEFIPVDPAVARGDTADLPQDALEDWSNAHNVFQFVRVEDLAYDPDDPRTVYIADTGNSRLTDAGNGRLYRASSGGTTSLGRIFKLVLNAADPTKVDSFSVVTNAETIGMRNPDNVAVSHDSLMVQEDTSNFSKIWRYSLAAGTWTHVATATQQPAETSGIVDVSRWLGAGWWALVVQSHINLPGEMPNQVYGGPGPNNGVVYTARREDGQLLLMRVPGS